MKEMGACKQNKTVKGEKLESFLKKKRTKKDNACGLDSARGIFTKPERQMWEDFWSGYETSSLASVNCQGRAGPWHKSRSDTYSVQFWWMFKDGCLSRLTPVCQHVLVQPRHRMAYKLPQVPKLMKSKGYVYGWVWFQDLFPGQEQQS